MADIRTKPPRSIPNALVWFEIANESAGGRGSVLRNDKGQFTSMVDDAMQAVRDKVFQEMTILNHHLHAKAPRSAYSKDWSVMPGESILTVGGLTGKGSDLFQINQTPGPRNTFSASIELHYPTGDARRVLHWIRNGTTGHYIEKRRRQALFIRVGHKDQYMRSPDPKQRANDERNIKLYGGYFRRFVNTTEGLKANDWIKTVLETYGEQAVQRVQKFAQKALVGAANNFSLPPVKDWSKYDEAWENWQKANKRGIYSDAYLDRKGKRSS